MSVPSSEKISNPSHSTSIEESLKSPNTSAAVSTGRLFTRARFHQSLSSMPDTLVKPSEVSTAPATVSRLPTLLRSSETAARTPRPMKRLP
jgi:hypothetical protein